MNMNWSRLIFAVIFFVSIAFFLRNLFRLFAMLCLGRWENHFDRLTDRLVSMLWYAFGQLRVVRSRFGYNHLLIFWGFMVLLLLNFEFLVAGLFPRFSLSFIGHTPYGVLLVLTEVMSVLVLAAVGAAAVRRIFFRPDYIEASLDAFLILGAIAVLMAAYFGFHAGEIRLGTTDYAAWMPVSRLAAGLYATLSPRGAEVVTGAFWWIHALVLLAFLNYLPYSKHLHILTAIPNCFFRSFTVPKTVQPLVFEKGNNFGVSKITQFTWKDLLHFMACTECGRCQAACPAERTGKSLNPRLLVHGGKRNLFINSQAMWNDRRIDSLPPPVDENEMPVALIGEGEESIAEEDLWACTTCGSCMVECPVFIEHVPKIIEMRRHLVMEQARFPEELNRLFENTEQRFNPWGIAPSDRIKWTQDLNVPVVEEGRPVEYLFFAGCSGAFDSRGRSVVASMTKILNAAGVSWAILGNEEKCCGDSLRRLGNEYVFHKLALDNLQMFKKYGVTRILTHCPHCYTTLKNDYAQFGADYEVIHHTEFLDQLVREGKITLQKRVNGRTVVHDSCYLGRYNGIYEAPRNLIRAASEGVPPLEMPRNEAKSFCCGAGGGRMWLEENAGKRIYLARTEEALATQPSTIAVACPYCMTMIEDGVKEVQAQDKVQVRDVAEIIAEAMETEKTEG